MENLPTIDELMQQACTVRDEDQPAANTARRVGSVLAGLVSALSASYPFSSASVRTTPQGMGIEYSVLRPDGTPESTMSLDLPPATSDAAGLLTAADKEQIDRTARTVDIGALDALLEGRNIIEILPLLGEWTVTDEFSGIPLPTGRLTMYADGMMHQVTQELHGNYLPDLTGHQDGRVNVLRRSYGIRAGGDGGLPPGEFSPWAYATAQPQASSEGSEADYIYSVPDTNDARCVMTVRNSEIFQNEGRLVYRRGFWSTAEEGGKYITRDIPEATDEAGGAMSAADKRLMASIVHLGEFASKDAACDWAARSEVAGNKRAALLLFTATGATGAKLEGRIIQQVNGNRESMQFLLWDKRLYRRNVTGASGTAGDATNSFPWEETGPQKLEYAPAVRTLRMKSYENGVVASVVLPEASTTAAGLMPKADKTFLESLQNTVLAQINQKIADLYRRVADLESAGA